MLWNMVYELREGHAIYYSKNNINYQSFNSNYLWSPKQILKTDGSDYKVFAAYKKEDII